ncbi:MAG: Hsp70 family protein [Oscillospiraceae bacterium]|nr:Hsp70 family protein [Oscillospiraceae bacterium]
MAIIGIDLGTTNSLCCTWQDGRTVLIPNTLEEYLTPSVVGLDENGTVLVGAVARERLATHPQWTTHNFKRLMGTSATTALGEREFLAEDLSAFILRRLREDAERFLRQPVDEAIISVPAYFNDDQRCATRDAARLAGLHVERLVNEPSAAALYYRQSSGSGDQSFLVFDFGGGTLDVSLVDCFENVIEILAVAGDNHLGGTDLDRLIAEHFCEHNALNWEALSPAGKALLLQIAEGAKKALSTQDKVVMSLRQDNRFYSLALDQQQLAHIAIPWLERCAAPIERVLRDAGRSYEDIDDILLVGGSCNMPLVQKYLRYRCQKPIRFTGRADMLVALGTGVYAGVKSREEDLQEVMMTDVCPFTLGTAVDSSGEVVMFPMIERNSILPSSVEHRFCTTQSFQTIIEMGVYQGEDHSPQNNLQLGKVMIRVPPAPAGEESVLVRFTYDINGILLVDVRHEETDAHEQLVLLGKRVQFSDEQWEQRQRELEALRINPLEQEENRLLLSWGERLYQEAVGEARRELGIVLENLNQALASQNAHRISRGRRDAKEYFQSVEDRRFAFEEIDPEEFLLSEES